MGITSTKSVTESREHLRLVSANQLTKDDIKNFISAKVAEIRGCTYEDIGQEIAQGGGNIELDSLEAVAAIASLESRIGRELAGAEDLAPDQLTTLDALTDLIVRQVDAPPKPKRDTPKRTNDRKIHRPSTDANRR